MLKHILATTTGLLLFGGVPSIAEAPPAPLPTIRVVAVSNSILENNPQRAIQFRHGDCSWVPAMALEAGWAKEDIPQLIKIIQRESGCCPNRAGGDIVDKNCLITGVSEWNHRSDSGLLQINGVHWMPEHKYYDGLVCKRMNICTQEPLLTAETNLRAGKLLHDVAGWRPWSVIQP